MNKDQIAIYLNEHPEFFNDYPELLRKIKEIQEEDLPLEPLGTLSLADRIIKRVHDDKQHLKSRLEWLVEICQANEKIQDHLFEIERVILSSSQLDQLVFQLQEEIRSRFAIPRVLVFLVDGADFFIENKLREQYGNQLQAALRFVDQETVNHWFREGARPVLRSETETGSEWCQDMEWEDVVKSEALIPIIVRDAVAGAIALGSEKPFHFHPGLRTEFLERMADKMAIAIDNILLMDRLRKQSVIDKQTGLYNRAYLHPVLFREFDRARRKKKTLSCVKMHIDYFPELLDTCDETKGESLLQQIGNLLTANCRSCDILIRTDVGEFLALLPDIDHNRVAVVAERIRRAMARLEFPEMPENKQLRVRVGIATFPSESVSTHQELLHAATQGLVDFKELDTQKAG